MRMLFPLEPDQIYLSDGGLETTLIFHDGIELPCFAAFDLLKSKRGRKTLTDYFRRYADVAVEAGCGFILESPTWRASRDWGVELGYNEDQIAAANQQAIDIMYSIRKDYADAGIKMPVSGNVGPRGDGYVVGARMTATEACDYHKHQIDALTEAGAEMITAITLTYVDEATGIVRAAQAANRPVVIGFTTETNGLLPSGDTLEFAIGRVDDLTDNGPAYYMVNCAHVDHFSSALDDDAAWTRRIRGIRANASRLSHAELDECDELDDGCPIEFGDLYRKLKKRLPHLLVFGGCCGTDHRHVDAVRLAVC